MNRWRALRVIVLTSFLAAGCTAESERPTSMLASQATWERTHFEYDGRTVEVLVPPGGRPPMGPPTNVSTAMTGYLVNRQYGWTQDYAPRFWLVVFCMKRMSSADEPLTAEALNADWVEIDRQYAADVGIKKGTVGMTPLQWQPIVLGQHTWFTDPSLTTAELFVTALSPSTLLAVRGVSSDSDPQKRADYRRVVEVVAARASFAR